MFDCRLGGGGFCSKVEIEEMNECCDRKVKYRITIFFLLRNSLMVGSSGYKNNHSQRSRLQVPKLREVLSTFLPAVAIAVAVGALSFGLRRLAVTSWAMVRRRGLSVLACDILAGARSSLKFFLNRM